MELTNTEKQILLLMSNGLTIAQIATSLRYGEETIVKHRSRLFVSLNAKNAPHAVRIAFENKLIS